MLGFPVADRAGMHTYTVMCWRAGPAWMVRLPSLDLESSAARLSQVEAVARALVSTYTEDDPEMVTFVVDLLPDTLSRTLGAAAAARAQSDCVSVESVRMRRALARQLSREGLPLLDVAAALGVSPQRARQLIGERQASGGTAPRSRTSAATGVAAAPGARGRSAPGASRPNPGGAPATPWAGRGRHDGYRHEALLYRGDEEFLAGTVPFVEEGLAMGQPVMVALPEPRLTMVREALDAKAAGVRLVDMGRLGRNPARIIPAWQQFVEEACRGGRPARGIGEPLWPGRHAVEVAECQLHEALLNIAVEPWRPLWLRCPYDVDRLGTPESEGALHSHPVIVEECEHSNSPHYAGPSHGPGVFASAPTAPPAHADRLGFAASSLQAVRPRVAEGASSAGLAPGRVADLTLAVWELAVNSVRHGGGGGVLRTWCEPDAFICEVSDHGHIEDPLAGRRAPDPISPGQRGIWLVNQLCDLVQLRSSPQGTRIRIFTWL